MPFVIVILWLAIGIGWVLNIVQVVGLAIANSDLSTLFILKVIGIPLGPLGSVLGWVTVFS